jgi:CubicO group peptidase (beta-lactamase class C family)
MSASICMLLLSLLAPSDRDALPASAQLEPAPAALVEVVDPELAFEASYQPKPPIRLDAAKIANIEGCKAAVEASKKWDHEGLLVMHKGQVVFEDHPTSWPATRPHPLASGTKSFSGVIAMMAIEDGLIKSLDERVADTITAWQSDPRKSQITVRHLLDLSSGLDLDEVRVSSLGRNRGSSEDVIRDSMRKAGLDMFQAAIDARTNHDPGSKFEYGSAHFYAFGAFMNAKLAVGSRPEKNIRDYMQARLFGPLGLKVDGIRGDVKNNPNLPGGARYTAKDWATFGKFILNQGAVIRPDGSRQQLVSWDLLKQCFEPSAKNPSYGLTWWLGGSQGLDEAQALFGNSPDGENLIRLRNRNRPPQPEQAILTPDGEPLKVWMAAGLGKQRLYVLPQLDVVVVRFGSLTGRAGRSFEDRGILAPILGQIEGSDTQASPKQQ